MTGVQTCALPIYRYGFVLHGLKANDFKHLNELLIQGIRNCIRDEKIKSEIIERYLKVAGELVFSKTRGAKYVARLNKACNQVNIFDDSSRAEGSVRRSPWRRYGTKKGKFKALYSSSLKMLSTGSSNSFAIFIANSSVGLYLSFSIALIVCRVTPN